MVAHVQGGCVNEAGAVVTGPELLFGVVRPVGTDGEKFRTALKASLNRYSYVVKDIPLSSLLRDHAAGRGVLIPERDEEKRIAALMDEGDQLCATRRTGSAVALLGVAAIRRHRAESNTKGPRETDESAADLPLARTAFVLDSLKRPAEITQLRRIYGDHFVVVSLQADLAARQKELGKRIGALRPTEKQTMQSTVSALIDRDLREADEFGQNTLRAFPMADVFIDLEHDLSGQVDRIVDLLFDSPEYNAPTVSEFGMTLAEMSSTRSTELGLKVGAALVAQDGDVLGVGHNAHPDPEHVPDVDPSTTDIVELIVDTLAALPAGTLAPEALTEFEDDRDAYASRLLAGPLATSRLRDLIEFQRPVHAEMNALLSAMRSRVDPRSATMYVTAYPCHHCARHLLKLGLKVTYLEPYPKSRAESMYGAAVDTSFHPFTGVAPRRYAQLFTVTGDRKDSTGVRRSWDEPERASAIPKLDPFIDPLGIADRELSALGVLAPSGGTGIEPGKKKLSHPRKTMRRAGTGTASPTPGTSRSEGQATSPTAPAPRKRRQGGRS
jgi:deoxycytidylate deaminase